MQTKFIIIMCVYVPFLLSLSGCGPPGAVPRPRLSRERQTRHAEPCQRPVVAPEPAPSPLRQERVWVVLSTPSMYTAKCRVGREMHKTQAI